MVMKVFVGENDIKHVVEADKAHVWHHLTPNTEVLIPPTLRSLLKGRACGFGIRLAGSISMRFRAAFGRSMWGMAVYR